MLCAELVLWYIAKAVLTARVSGSCCHHYQPLDYNCLGIREPTGQHHEAAYLEMLVHNDLAILLKYAQYVSTLSQVPRPGVDFDMDSSAYCFSIGWDRLPCKGNPGYYHVLNEALCTEQ